MATSANPTSSTTQLALLMLADGRFPAGGHAHSAGVESAIRDGRIADESTLESFVHGRIVSTGLVDAALAAATLVRLAACADSIAVGDLLHRLDREAEARIVVPTLRASSRRLGRQLARSAARCWPSGELAMLAGEFPGGAHHSVVLGCAGVAIGATAEQVAELSVHHTVTTPAQAAVRLLGLDPYAVAALSARLAGPAAIVAALAVEAASGPIARLPARSAPLADIAATDHAGWPVKHFAT